MSRWKELKEAACLSGSQEDVATCLAPVQSWEDATSGLTLYAPNPFVIELLRERFTPLLREAKEHYGKVTLLVGDPPREGDTVTAVRVQSPPPARSPVEVLNRPATIGEGPRFPVVWPHSQYAVISHLARSSLFSATRFGPKTPRPYFKNHLLVSAEGVEIRTTGEQLTVDDGEVHMQVMNYQLASGLPLGADVPITLAGLTFDLGKNSDGGKGLNQTRESLYRLRGTEISIKVASRGGQELRSFTGNLLNHIGARMRRGDRDAAYSFSLRPEIFQLFGVDTVYRIDRRISRALRAKLAQWLHRYYSTHQHPYPMKLETLQRMCGAKASPKKFREQMREALNELVDHQFLAEWRIDEDLVFVRRAGGIALPPST